MGYAEIYAIAEIVNSEAALARLREEFSMDSDALAAMRRCYGSFNQ